MICKEQYKMCSFNFEVSVLFHWFLLLLYLPGLIIHQVSMSLTFTFLPISVSALIQTTFITQTSISQVRDKLFLGIPWKIKVFWSNTLGKSWDKQSAYSLHSSWIPREMDHMPQQVLLFVKEVVTSPGTVVLLRIWIAKCWHGQTKVFFAFL